MLFWRPRLLALLLLSCALTQVIYAKKDPPPTPSPTRLASKYPSLSPSVTRSLSPTAAKLSSSTSFPTFVPTESPTGLIQPPVVTLKRHEISISSMTLLLGPALSEFSEVETGLIEQVTETHLVNLFNAKYKNSLNVITLNSIPVPDTSRRKLQSGSTQVAFEGAGVLFASTDLEDQDVNDYILFEAFEDGNGEQYLDSLTAVLSKSDLTYVSASKVTITPGPGTEESSSSSGSSSFWDSYRIYIIIVLCCIVFVAMLFALHTYNNRDEKSGGVIDPKNRSFKLTDEGSINSRSYSRQRFFEKPVEVDHEANNTSAVVDPFEFEHNLDHVQAPPAAQDFQFQQDPEEDRRAHYYAERDKYNANFREQEMAAAKGRALANTAQSDPTSANASPSSLGQHNLGPIMEERGNRSFSTTSEQDSQQRGKSAFISPLHDDTKYGKYYENHARRIQLQPSDEDTISLSPRSPKTNQEEAVAISPKANNMPQPPSIPVSRNAQPSYSNPPPPAHLQHPLRIEELAINPQCAVDLFSQYLSCGNEQGVEVSHFEEPIQEQIQMQEITIVAPVGKLGVYLDGSTDVGEPCRVHGLKPASVLQGKLFAGDALVRINDIDVTGMEAVEVSKLLSRSNKKKRRITVFRSFDHPTVAAIAQRTAQKPSSGPRSVTSGGPATSVANDEKMQSIVLNAQRSLSKQRSFSREQPQLRKFRSGREVKGLSMGDDDSDSDLSEIIVDGVD